MSNRGNGILEHRIPKHGAVRVADASGQGSCGIMRGGTGTKEKGARWTGTFSSALQNFRKVRIS